MPNDLLSVSNIKSTSSNSSKLYTSSSQDTITMTQITHTQEIPEGLDKKKVQLPPDEKLPFFKKVFIKPIVLFSRLKTFFLGIIGALIGFGAALLFFPENAGLFAVFFITIFLAPFIQKQINYNELILGRTETLQKKGVSLVNLKVVQGKFSFKEFYRNNKPIIRTYLHFFLGVFLVVMILIISCPPEFSAQLFGQQGWEQNLMPSKEMGFEGQAKFPIFKGIILNNFSVLLVSFILAAIFPLGAILMIVWNGVYWGVVFSQYGLFYSMQYGTTLLAIFIPLLLSIALHTIIEIISYFYAAISGNLLSVGISKEKGNPDRLMEIIKYCLILLGISLVFLIIGGFAEVYVFDILQNFFFSFL
ncbi:MAG TPA: stage II sporulation protein M [archaeon]|jgi:uncharacterized membrane protein SpoIIM required for sporulation|nr:stage II sporulation protein M [archaeon]HRT02704.1 stage II sporulation protein M [Candidatus Diapherotrites archaeon]